MKYHRALEYRFLKEYMGILRAAKDAGSQHLISLSRYHWVGELNGKEDVIELNDRVIMLIASVRKHLLALPKTTPTAG